MLIPKQSKNPQIKMKKCAVDGCEETFAGGPSSKFCSKHRDPKSRGVVKNSDQEHTDVNNLVFQHEFTDVKVIQQSCALDGCTEHFDVKIYPRQFVYPKYCPLHRNEQKRKSHLSHLTHMTQLAGRHH